jgi:hypothetical protein
MSAPVVECDQFHPGLAIGIDYDSHGSYRFVEE